MQKGSALIFLLVGALVLFIAGGAFYLGRSTLLRQDSTGQATPKPTPVPVTTSQTPQSSPIPNVSPVPNGTGETANSDSIRANWKTYTSEYGYSFRYPQSWEAVESVGDEGAMVYSKPEYIQLSEQLGQGFDKEDYAIIDVGMYLKGQQVAGNQTVSQETDVKDFVSRLYSSIIQSKEDTTLDGKPAVLVTLKRMVLPPGVAFGSQNDPIQNGTTKSVWTKYNGNILFINYDYGRQYKDSNTLPIIFNQVLSTFKFTQ